LIFSDIQKIENAIEINVIILIEQTVSLIVAFIIAISLSWKLTLAICALIPFLLLGIVITARVRLIMEVYGHIISELL
jgi:ABC-type multidrug transport system fused ATPase/permease subunit